MYDINNQTGFTSIVGVAGTIMAVAFALIQGWRGRAKWEPSEEDIDKGPQRVASLLVAVFTVVLWVLTRNQPNMSQLSSLAIFLAVATAIFLLIYTFLVSRFTAIKKAPGPNEKIIDHKIISGFQLTPGSKTAIKKSLKAGQQLTEQQLFAGAGYDPDMVWTATSRSLNKVFFLMCYLGLTAAGTIALATVAILLGNP